MCFSATASFTAAAVLTVVGFYTISKTSQKNQIFIALIPYLFAFQQLVEGFLWLSLQNPAQFERFAPIGKLLYLSIAISIWPVWIPLSLWAVETIRWRQLALLILLLVGIAFNGLLFYHVGSWETLKQVSVSIVNHNIQYQSPLQLGEGYELLYFVAVLFPLFISSWRYMWIIGLLITAGLAIAAYSYTHAFISVWCFFAAIVSIALYFVFRANTRTS